MSKTIYSQPSIDNLHFPNSILLSYQDIEIHEYEYIVNKYQKKIVLCKIIPFKDINQNDVLIGIPIDTRDRLYLIDYQPKDRNGLPFSSWDRNEGDSIPYSDLCVLKFTKLYFVHKFKESLLKFKIDLSKNPLSRLKWFHIVGWLNGKNNGKMPLI